MRELAYHLFDQAKVRKAISHQGAKLVSEEEFLLMSQMGELKGGGSSTMIEARQVASRSMPGAIRMQLRLFKDLGNYNYGRWFMDTYQDTFGLSEEHIADCVAVALALR